MKSCTVFCAGDFDLPIQSMDGELITSVDFGYQRQISDIIYFATALPDGE